MAECEIEMDGDIGRPRQDSEFSRSMAKEIELRWKDIRFDVQMKGKDNRQILKGVTGTAGKGELTAIMGSSGAGKTSLLNILAGRTQEQKSTNAALTTIEGKVYLNGNITTPELIKKYVAYVMQEDVMMETLTPREMFQFSARLRLPKTLTDEEVSARVEDIISVLKLEACADTRVGNAASRGLSGGEKKRTAIGVELVTNPSVLFLDEPTSGLDSFTAQTVIENLKHLARDNGRTVICTIHQPSSDIFELFDKLILMQGGEIIYSGPASGAVEYFKDFGFECPLYSNPADYFMKIMSTDTTDSLRPMKDAAHEQGHQLVVAEPGILTSDNPNRVDDRTALALLFHRAIKNFTRNEVTTKVRMGQTIFMALLTGLLYINVSNDQTSIGDRQGAIFFIVTSIFMTSSFSVVLTFPSEKVLFARERSNNMYTTTQYFVSKLISECPIQLIFPLVYSVISYFIIGLQSGVDRFFVFAFVNALVVYASQSVSMLFASQVPNQDVALSLQPVVIIPFLLFSGFFIESENIPPYFVWIEAISPFRYGFEALLINEYSGLAFECTADQFITVGATEVCPFTTGDQVLASLGLEHNDLYRAYIVLSVIIISCFTLTWANLVRKK